MKQMIWIVGSLLALLVGLACILPALAKLRAFGYLSGPDIGFLFLGLLVAGAGPITAFFACRRPRA
jgi:hypothetical protein